MWRSRIVYFLFTALMAAFVFVYETSLTYAAFYLVVSAPAASFLATLLCASRFRVGEKLSAEIVTKGETSEYTFTMENRGFMPFARVRAFFFADTDAIVSTISDKIFSVAPFGKRQAVFTLVCPFRGEYRLGVRKVVLYDPLGLFKFTRKTKTRGVKIIVNPRVVKLNDFPLMVREDETRSLNSFAGEDYAVVSELRQYAEGDSMRKIHWKASAKRGELIVKNYQILSKNRVLLLFDNGAMTDLTPRDALEKQDLMVEALASAAKFCADEQFPAYIGLLEKPAFFAPSPFERLYAEAAALKFPPPPRDFEDLAAEFMATSDYINFVLFIRRQTAELKRLALEMTAFGHNVIIIPFTQTPEADRNDREELERAGVAFYDY